MAHPEVDQRVQAGWFGWERQRGVGEVDPGPAARDDGGFGRLRFEVGERVLERPLELLFAAFRSEYQVTVEYVVTDYKGKAFRCLTGFTISKT